MENFGDYLKAHREKKGIRLEELASITKITLTALKNLEANRWDKLPPDPFLRGFVTSYARYVGIETPEVMERYRKAIQGNVESDENGMVPPSVKALESPPVEAGRTANQVISETTGLPLGKMAWGLGGVLVLIVTASLIYVGKSQAPEEEVAETETTTITETAAAPPGSAPTTTASVTPGAPSGTTVTNTRSDLIAGSQRSTAAVLPEPLHKLLIRGQGKTYIKVVVDNEPPMEYFLSNHKTAGYAARQKIKLLVGDISKANVSYNDNQAVPARKDGNVVTFIYPAGATFPQDVRTTSSTTQTQEE